MNIKKGDNPDSGDDPTSLMKLANEVQAQLNDLDLHYEKMYLGDRLSSLLVSHEATLKAFYDPDAKIRAGALLLETLHWKPTWVNDRIYHNIYMHDVDPSVRSTALATMISLRIGSENNEFCHELARVVRDEKDESLRRTAYIGLVRLSNKLSASQVRKKVMQRRGDMLNSIDWGLVNSFLD